jgi:MFS family permease
MAEQNIGWNIIFLPTPAIRRMLIVGVATAVSQQAVGIDAIQYYLMDILKESGIENEKSRLGVLMLLGMVKLVFIFVGGYYFDKSGRRPLFFISLLGKSMGLHLYLKPTITSLFLTAIEYRNDRGSDFGCFQLHG